MLLERLLVPVICLGIEVFVRVLGEEVEIRQIATDKGTENVTIPCGSEPLLPAVNVQWVHKGNRTHHDVLVSTLPTYH
ncbi:unnamed protein product [Leptosia nina]|uniref:Ig-like domain-containing protein n=1 Tax=Leptosia nina TaxID=320188 RepID=A0AAV1JPU4_9NEOP